MIILTVCAESISENAKRTLLTTLETSRATGTTAARANGVLFEVPKRQRFQRQQTMGRIYPAEVNTKIKNLCRNRAVWSDIRTQTSLLSDIHNTALGRFLPLLARKYVLNGKVPHIRFCWKGEITTYTPRYILGLPMGSFRKAVPALPLSVRPRPFLYLLGFKPHGLSGPLQV